MKGPPLAATAPRPSGPLVRHCGKQPRKELITDFFTAKKVVTVVGKDVDAILQAGGAAAGAADATAA